MEIITETLDTAAIIAENVADSILKLYSAGEKGKRLNQSLDLKREEYCEVALTKEGDLTVADLCWVLNGLVISTYSVYEIECKSKAEIAEEIKSWIQVMDKRRASQTHFEKKCYAAYQLDWMLSHGIGLDMLYKEQLEQMQDMFDPEDYRNSQFDKDDLARSMEQGRDQILFNRGFYGQMFASKPEFLTHEFYDADYMKGLLERMEGDAAALKAEYTRITGKNIADDHIEAMTSAGVIKAEKTSDPEFPGIAVTLTPAGAECEIDLFRAEVNEATDYGERPIDVVMYTWGDPSQEDYTDKTVLRREAVMDALELTYTWNDISMMADGTGHGDPKLKAKDWARWQVHGLALDKGLDDPEEAEIPEEAVEEICEKYDIRFCSNGEIISYKGMEATA